MWRGCSIQCVEGLSCSVCGGAVVFSVLRGCSVQYVVFIVWRSCRVQCVEDLYSSVCRWAVVFSV